MPAKPANSNFSNNSSSKSADPPKLLNIWKAGVALPMSWTWPKKRTSRPASSSEPDVKEDASQRRWPSLNQWAHRRPAMPRVSIACCRRESQRRLPPFSCFFAHRASVVNRITPFTSSLQNPLNVMPLFYHRQWFQRHKTRWGGKLSSQAGFTRLPGNRVNLPLPYLFSVVHFIG